MSRKKLSRRQFVAATAMSSAVLITAPYIRTAHAAGKLSMGFWDHWVPGANKACTELVAKETGQTKFSFVGESSGGLRAGVLAMEHPELIHKLVLLANTAHSTTLSLNRKQVWHAVSAFLSEPVDATKL